MPMYILYLFLFLDEISRYSRMIIGLQGSVDEFGFMMFLIINFATHIVYYSCVYDPAGTYKPGWTDYLG